MTSVFRDPGVEPRTEAIHAALGPASDAWDRLTGVVTDSGALLVWRYYRDGGWLARATKGQKTVAWLSVARGQVTITFYFAERHRPILTQDPALTDELRHQIQATALSGRLLPVTLVLHDDRHLHQVRALLATKMGTLRTEHRGGAVGDAEGQ